MVSALGLMTSEQKGCFRSTGTFFLHNLEKLKLVDFISNSTSNLHILLILSAQNHLQKFKIFQNHQLQLSMRTENVPVESNLYSPLISRFLLNVCVCVCTRVCVCVCRWDEGSEESVEQEGNQVTDAKKRTIGNSSMKTALIFFLYLPALNNSIHFTSINTIVILLSSPFPPSITCS